jgi:hypothetical protein
MRIGIDLDNTLADYSAPLLRLCALHGVDPGVDPKLALREHLRGAGREHEWTRWQGEIYGLLMAEALLFPGVADFFRRSLAAGSECFIVSHRTRQPILGEAHDLHSTARHWLRAVGLANVPVHLEESKSAKVDRIRSLGVDIFIDDLPELLSDSAFPEGVRRILFDPGNRHANSPAWWRCNSWHSVASELFES